MKLSAIDLPNANSWGMGAAPGELTAEAFSDTMSAITHFHGPSHYGALA